MVIIFRGKNNIKMGDKILTDSDLTQFPKMKRKSQKNTKTLLC